MPRQRRRRWCFTINNPTKADEQAVEAIPCKYVICGREIGEEKGTPHLQGYIELDKASDVAVVCRMLGGRAAVFACNGSQEQNVEYCSKESVWHERGTKARPGTRNDLQAVKAVVKNTGRMRDVIEVASNYQAVRGGELLLKYIGPTKREVPEVYWYWGASGSGKTRRAFEEAGDDVWVSSRGLKWWDGYDGHKCVIIDDFREDFCTFHELLRILDRYPYRVEVKGGSRMLLATKIWVTCPKPPDLLYLNCREELDQLIRRITRIVHIRGTVVQRSGVILGPDLDLYGNEKKE